MEAERPNPVVEVWEQLKEKVMELLAIDPPEIIDQEIQAQEQRWQDFAESMGLDDQD